jgi:hypothetical protein
MLLVPKNQWFYIIGGLLSFIVWLAFWRFRDTKLGIDVADICFWDFMAHSIVPFGLYLARISPEIMWYVWTGFSALKITRVYIWQTSATQQYGWPRFGPMTWYYHKNVFAVNASIPWRKLVVEIACALVVAIIVAIFIKQLSDVKRVVFMWAVPLTFEFLYGPTQLRNLTLLGNLFAASTQREAELAEKLAACEQKLASLQQGSNIPDDACADIVAFYSVLPPERKSGLHEFAKHMAKNFGLDNPDNVKPKN